MRPDPMHGPIPPAGPPPIPFTSIGIIMGTPRAGKSTTAIELAKRLGYGVIDADQSVDDRYEYLEQRLAEFTGSQGVLVVGYGADSDADIFYLLHALQKPQFRIVYVAYMDMPYNYISKRKEGQEEKVSSNEMSTHCTGYESCSKYLADAPGFHLIPVIDDLNNDRPTPSLVFEMSKTILENAETMRRSPNTILIPMPSCAVFERWALETDYKKFRAVVRRLDEALGTKAFSGIFPLRISGQMLDYNKFVRHHHQLQQYDVGLATNGARVVVFKIGQDVYALQEHCSSVYRLEDPKLDPFQSLHPKEDDEVVFALEAEFCTVRVQTAVDDTDANHVLIRDLLYFSGRLMNRTPRHMRKDIIATHFKESQSQYVLVHVSYTIDKITELLNVGQSIESIVTGLRFEHPYAYRVRSDSDDYDNRLMCWADGEKPLATLRLWNSTAVTIDHENHYRFELMVVDDETGMEVVLQEEKAPIPGRKLKDPNQSPVRGSCTVDISFALAEKEDINDGQLIECRFVRNAPPPAKSGPAARSSASKQDHYTIGNWIFVRRRRELLFPAYASTVVEAMRDRGWARDHLANACQEIVYRDPASQRQPGSPTA